MSDDDVKKRSIVIVTDGNNVTIEKMECTPLELKEICRMILKKLGD